MSTPESLSPPTSPVLQTSFLPRPNFFGRHLRFLFNPGPPDPSGVSWFTFLKQCFPIRLSKAPPFTCWFPRAFPPLLDLPLYESRLTGLFSLPTAPKVNACIRFRLPNPCHAPPPLPSDPLHRPIFYPKHIGQPPPGFGSPLTRPPHFS